MLLTLLERIVAPIFYKLLYMSVTALVVGMIIMLIRRFADKRFSPFWKYTMWVLVLAALIIPWRPQSNLAVMNNTERIQEISFRNEYVAAQTEYQQAAINEAGDKLIYEQSEQLIEAKAKVNSLHVKTMVFDSIIPMVWLSGVVSIGLFMLLSGLRLGRKIRNSTVPFETERYETTLQNCKNKFGIKRRVWLVIQSYVKTPALFGLFRPAIILPEYAGALSDEHLEYVILHELSHLKRGDSVVNTLLLALQTIYWFNPLTWLLFKFIREDMELANDAAVLKGMDNEKQKDYSLSLVEVLAGYGKPALAPRLLCMVDSEKNMERRINMIKLGEFFKRRKWIIAISSLLVIAITATLFLTAGAVGVNADKYKIEITNDIIDKVDGISRGYYFSQIRDDGFLITASKIHGAYKQNGEIRIFVTTYYSTYSIENDTIIQGSAGIVPAAITCEEIPVSERGWLDYTEAQDGSKFRPSIEDFCKLPSGKTIKGLASKIINHYGHHSDLNELHQQKLDEYLESNGLSGYPVRFPKTQLNKPLAPNISVTIEEYYGEADTALEVIYEDAHYKYSLSSSRSDKIMLTFEDGQKISLKDAISQKKIGIEDLILNGLQVWMEPRNNPMGGYFNTPSHLYKFYIGEFEFYPSNNFMYSTEDNGFNSYFAVDEFLGYLEQSGYKEIADWFRSSNIRWARDNMIEGIRYLRQSEFESIGISVQIGWKYSSHTPVWFNFSDSSGTTSAPETNINPNVSVGDAEMFSTAAEISSDQFLSVKKNMSMQQVMDTLGKTAHVIGQGPSSMYYYVDGKPLKIDFGNLSDPYPFSGEVMKQYFDTFGAVSFKTIFMDDVMKLDQGMKIDDIIKALGNTVDVGSGRYILRYSVWDGLSLVEFTFNSGGGELPYSGEEIYAMILNGQSGVTW